MIDQRQPESIDRKQCFMKRSHVPPGTLLKDIS